MSEPRFHQRQQKSNDIKQINTLTHRDMALEAGRRRPALMLRPELVQLSTAELCTALNHAGFYLDSRSPASHENCVLGQLMLRTCRLESMWSYCTAEPLRLKAYVADLDLRALASKHGKLLPRLDVSAWSCIESQQRPTSCSVAAGLSTSHCLGLEFLILLSFQLVQAFSRACSCAILQRKCNNLMAGGAWILV